MKKLLIIFFLILANILNADQRSFTINIDLTETAINRALQYWYNDISCPQQISGTIPGTTYDYSLTLNLPSIILEEDEVRLNMSIYINSDIGNYDVTIEPNIVIPQSSISSSEVIGVLNNVVTVVNLLDLPSDLKNVLITSYENLQCWILPSKLAQQANSTWLNERGINLVDDLVLGWNVNEGKLTLSITTNVESNAPNFSVAAIQDANTGLDHFFVLSNIEVIVDEIELVTLGGTTVWSSSTNISCEKGVERDIDMGDTTYDNGPCYAASILYKIEDTFYYREYSCVTTEYTGSTLGIN